MNEDIKNLQTLIDAATSKGVFSSARAAAAMQLSLDRVTNTLIEYARKCEPNNQHNDGQQPGQQSA